MSSANLLPLKKRYLIFVYDNYYPMGGFHDLVADLDDENEAKGYALGACREVLKKAHVVDTQTMKIIFEVND